MVAVVSERTQLRKAGARYMGRCPFHEERTPSFSVNAVDKFYYCFGCGAKGDLITFVRETEQLDFAEAIEWLADRFNVQIEYEETSPQQDARRRRRERLLELLEAAASFYERYLWESQAGSLARDYLAGRGLREEVCRQYRLGLALGGTTLTREVLSRREEWRERQDAIRYAAATLGLPKETQAGLAPRGPASWAGRVSARLLDAGERLEQNALAGVAAHPTLLPVLAELGPEHFDGEEHRRLREQLVSGSDPDAELVGLAAELDARATSEGIDERTAEELLLRLRARGIKRELSDADPARTLELQASLAKIVATVEELAAAQVFSR